MFEKFIRWLAADVIVQEREIAYQEGVCDGDGAGHEDGYNAGYEDGYDNGYNDGYCDGENAEA